MSASNQSEIPCSSHKSHHVAISRQEYLVNASGEVQGCATYSPEPQGFCFLNSLPEQRMPVLEPTEVMLSTGLSARGGQGRMHQVSEGC